MRQGEEDHVVAGEHLGFGGVEHPTLERQQMRVVFGDVGSGALRRGQRTDRQATVAVGGVAEE